MLIYDGLYIYIYVCIAVVERVMRKVLMRDYVDILSSSDIWEGGASRIGGIFKNIFSLQNFKELE